MIYDALNYGAQVKEAAKKHKENKDYESDAEFLSGFTKTDKLTPIIPITLYLGPEEWDAPVSLHEMFGEFDERLRSFVPDYRIVLVTPNDLEESDLDKLDTDLREFLGAIKYSQSKEEFESYILENLGLKNLDNETVEAINLFTGSDIKINKEGGSTDMCKAIEDMKKEAVMNQTMESLKIMFENGGSFELAVKMFQNISEEVIRNIYEDITGTKAPV